MPSKNDPDQSEDAQPPDLFSSAEMRAMLDEFHKLVRAGILRVTPENELLPGRQQPGEAEKPPVAPASREDEVALLDRQLRDWLERRRDTSGAKSEKGETARRREPIKPLGQAGEVIPAGIRETVIERVAQKVIEVWDRLDRAADPRQSLREQIVDHIAEDLVRRLQRNLE